MEPSEQCRLIETGSSQAEAVSNHSEQVVTRNLGRRYADTEEILCIKLRPQMLYEHSFAGANLSGNNNETLLLREAI